MNKSQHDDFAVQVVAAYPQVHGEGLPRAVAQRILRVPRVPPGAERSPAMRIDPKDNVAAIPGP